MSKRIRITFKCLFCDKEAEVEEGDIIHPCECMQEDFKKFQEIQRKEIEKVWDTVDYKLRALEKGESK